MENSFSYYKFGKRLTKYIMLVYLDKTLRL